jgi:hypothetical protein
LASAYNVRQAAGSAGLNAVTNGRRRRQRPGIGQTIPIADESLKRGDLEALLAAADPALKGQTREQGRGKSENRGSR